MLYIANYGTAISTAALNAINSFVALADTPAGNHLAKVAGAFANTPDTGGGGGTPGGSSTQLQYNAAGSFGGISGATTNGTTTTFLANNLSIADQTTPTKIAQFSAASITAATTRTYTLPDASDTIVLLTLAQTVTNKTLGNTNIITVRDDRFTLQDDGDTSKQVVFQLSGLTAATTRTLTVPDANGTMTLLGNASTGSGSIVLATSPTLVTPVLGAATATSINSLTITTSTGTFTLTNAKVFTVTNTLTLSGTDGSTLNIGAGGTLGSNAYTSTAYAPIASPTFTGVVTIPTPFTLGAVSVTSTGTQLNYLSAATGTTGTTSTNLVFSTSPTLVTPVLGVATATSINGNTFTTGTYTLTGVAGKTLTFNNSITIAGTDATVMTFPTTSKTIAANDGSNWTFGSQAIGDLVYASSTTAFTRLAAVAVGSVLVSAGTGTAPVWSAGPQVTTIELGNATDTTISRASAGQMNIEGVQALTASNTVTVTNKRNTKRLVAVTQSATPAINSDNMDIASITALAQAITSMSSGLSGTPVNGDMLMVQITGTATRTIAWGASFASTASYTLPTTTSGTTMLRILLQWNSVTTVWECLGSS